jgi:hypothetical protein
MACNGPVHRANVTWLHAYALHCFQKEFIGTLSGAGFGADGPIV